LQELDDPQKNGKSTGGNGTQFAQWTKVYLALWGAPLGPSHRVRCSRVIIGWLTAIMYIFTKVSSFVDHAEF
jgi:hypothetical protein